MASSPSFVTPLRYPGGKGRLGAWLGDLIRANGFEDCRYIEPYAGGAGAAVFLLLNGYVDKIVINDADPVIYAFWWSVLNDADGLIEKILKTPVTMESWHLQRGIVAQQDCSDLTKLGFATFFLNRTNRSGIIKGGVIGGKRQDGKYKLDARYNKEDLVARIRRFSSLSERVSLFGLDAMDLIKSDSLELDDNCLIYLDPPYFNKGSQLYRNHYRSEDHASIAKSVRELNVPWIVTYDNCEEINSIYLGAKRVEFSISYSTHLSRPKAKEVMFYNNLHLNSVPTLKR